MVEVIREEDEFLDIMHPVLCYTCGENVASRVNEFEELCISKSKKEALDAMGITRLCTRHHFVTGGSNVIVTMPCEDCVRGNSCAVHNIWHPEASTVSHVNISSGPEQEVGEEQAGKDKESAISLPLSLRRAQEYDSSHIPMVSKITNLPTQFGIPTHLSQYDSLSTKITLESGDEVSVIMGQVYRTTNVTM